MICSPEACQSLVSAAAKGGPRDMRSDRRQGIIGLPPVDRLKLSAMKVVDPGESGQAVGCDTHRHDRRIARMNIHKNAHLTPPEPALAKAGVDSCSGLRVAAGGSRWPQ
jgi:hypothetical protein